MRTKRNTNIKVGSNLRSNEKQCFSNKKKTFLTLRSPILTVANQKGFPKFICKEKSTVIWIKLETKVTMKLGNFFRYTKNVSRDQKNPFLSLRLPGEKQYTLVALKAKNCSKNFSKKHERNMRTKK